MITVDQLVKLGASQDNANKYCQYLINTCFKYEINTDARICQFLAQVFVESNALATIKENLNYSQAGLVATFPSHFPNLPSTVGYGRSATSTANQEAINAKLYNNFCGRGLIQITNQANYQSVSKALGIDCVSNPSLLEQPQYSCLSAGFFWNSIKANSIADIDNAQAVKSITRLVNGPAYKGLNERIAFWNKAKTLFI